MENSRESRTYRPLLGAALLWLSLGLFGCGGAPVSGEETLGSQEGVSDKETAALNAVDTKPPGDDVTPPVLATASLSNGNTAVFYDAGSAVLIAEKGKALVEPMVAKLAAGNKGDPVATWKALAPNRPVPGAIVDAAARIAQSPAPQSRPPIATELPSGASSGVVKKGGVVANALYGCNNGCCDVNWTANSLCSSGGNTNWYYFNSSASWEDSGGNAWSVASTVCAATGWSHWKVTVGSSNYAWWVPQGSYQQFSWVAADYLFYGWDSKHLTSRVNMDSTDAKNNHMHCGSYWF